MTLMTTPAPAGPMHGRTMATSDTHSFMATTCLHLGRPCPAAERMIRVLAQALDMAKGSTDGDFEVSGQSLLDGCEKSCPARFQASHSRIRVFCGAQETDDLGALNQFADAMLAPHVLPVPTKVTPGSFVEALPKATAN